jgi:TFIIF-interacting CTD phosphatase-like protein
VINQIDSNDRIQHRLYRQHALSKTGGALVKKDLSKIGRNLKTSIIVDNVADNFILQPDNGIFIKTWYDDMTDTCLEDMIPLLRGISN